MIEAHNCPSNLIARLCHALLNIGLQAGIARDQDVSTGNQGGQESLAPRGEVVVLGRTRPNPAIQNNWVYHLLALDVEKVQDTDFDSTEDVTTRLVPVADVAGLIENGAITHALVLTAFYHFALRG